MIFTVILKNDFAALSEEQMTALKGFLISELKFDVPTAQKIIQNNLHIFASQVKIESEIVMNKLRILGLNVAINEVEDENENEDFSIESFLESNVDSEEDDTSSVSTAKLDPTVIIDIPENIEATSKKKEEKQPKDPIIGLSRANFKSYKDFEYQQERHYQREKKQTQEIKHEEPEEDLKEPRLSPRLQNLIIVLVSIIVLVIVNYSILPKKKYEEIKILASEIDPTVHVLRSESSTEELNNAEVHVINLFLKQFSFSFSSKKPPLLTAEELVVAKTHTPWIKLGSVSPIELPRVASKTHSFQGTAKLTIGYGTGELKLVALADINLKFNDLKSGNGDVFICYRCDEIKDSKQIAVLPDGEIGIRYFRNFTFKE